MATLMNYADNAFSFVGKKARKLMLMSGVAFAAFGCSNKKDDPSPIIGVDEKRVEHIYDVGINIKVSDASSNYFMPVSIRKLDGSLASGLNASVTGQDASRVATGASTADNIKFDMSYNVKNIAYKNNALVPINPDSSVIRYRQAEGSELKDFVVFEQTKKEDGGNLIIETHYHPKEASVFAPPSGVKLLGTTFTNDTFNEFIKNSDNTKDVFTKLNVMSLEKPTTINANSFYKLKK